MSCKRNKYLSLILLIILIIFTFSIYVGIADNEYVLDEANIIGEDVKIYIKDVNEELVESNSPLVYVKSVSSLNKQSIDKVADEIFKKINKENILILLAPNENKAYIKVGKDNKDLFPDRLRSDIEYDKILSNFEKGLFDRGVLDGFDSVINPLAEREGVKIKSKISLNEEKPTEGSNITWKLIIVFIGFIFIDLIVFDASFINTVSRAVVGFRGEYRGNMSPYRTSERYRGAGTGPRDDWPSDLEKKNKYGNW